MCYFLLLKNNISKYKKQTFKKMNEAHESKLIK